MDAHRIACSVVALIVVGHPAVPVELHAPCPTRVVVTEGQVFAPDGAPATDVAVSSSAGGDARTDVEGRYQLHAIGARPALFVVGTFVTACGASARGVATWDGTRWPGFGAGLGESGCALESFDDGTGPGLFVGGRFGRQRESDDSHLARWGLPAGARQVSQSRGAGAAARCDELERQKGRAQHAERQRRRDAAHDGDGDDRQAQTETAEQAEPVEVDLQILGQDRERAIAHADAPARAQDDERGQRGGQRDAQG